MAIAYSDDGAFALNIDQTTASFSMSCSGTDRILYVGLYTRKRTSDNTISSITYNGDAMTAAGNDTLPSFVDNKMRYRDFYLLNPDDGGDHSVSVTMSSSTDTLGMTGISFNGAAQEAPEAVNDATGTTSPATVSVTTLTDGAVLTGGISVFFPTAQTVTENSGQTETYVTPTSTFLVIAAGYELITTAGSEPLEWTLGATANNWGIGAVSLAPAGAAVAEEPAVFFGANF